MEEARQEKIASDIEAIADALTIVALRESRQMGDESALLAATNRLRLRSENLNRMNEGGGR